MQTLNKSANGFAVRYRRAKMNIKRKQKPEADLNAQTDLDMGLVLNVKALESVSQAAM